MKSISRKSTRKMPLLMIVMAVMFPLMAVMATGLKMPDGHNDPKTDLNWLLGTWENTELKGTFEKWELVGDTLKGKSYKLKKGNEVISQTMYFTTDGGQMYYHYTRIVKKKEVITTLKLMKATDITFIFADKDAKYPEFATFQNKGNNEYAFEFKWIFGDMQATSTSTYKRVQ